jgi:peptide/nickel transport system substrate-binding protein
VSIALLVPTAVGTPAAAQEEASGGTFVAAWIGPCCLDVDTNNVLAAGGDYHWWNKIYGRLFTYEVKDQQYGDLIGDLAETWEVSEDGLTWTIGLREGVTWHDGEPFTANDVKFTLELCSDPTAGGCVWNFAPIVGIQDINDGAATEASGITVVDDLTLSIQTTQPNALLPDLLSEIFILPQHSLGQIPRDQISGSDWWTTQQIGTGPFKWSNYTPGQSIELVRFDDYWRGAPKLDGIIRRQFQDVSAALLAFESGEIDMTYVTADEIARLRESGVGQVFEGPSGVDNYIQFNSVKYPDFEKPEVRQAALMAIDRQAIIDNIYGGAAQLVPCLYGKPNLTGETPIEGYDPEGAQALLQEAGVDLSALGELVFDTYYGDPISAAVMTAIQANWADNIGLRVSTQPFDPSAWTKRYYEDAAFDISFGGGANGPTGNRAYQYFHSSSAYPTGNNGFTGWSYSNADLDELLDAAPSEFDQAAQDAIYQQACAIMAEDLPWLFMWQSIRYHIVSSAMHNVILIPAAGGGTYYDAVETWTKDA